MEAKGDKPVTVKDKMRDLENNIDRQQDSLDHLDKKVDEFNDNANALGKKAQKLVADLTQKTRTEV